MNKKQYMALLEGQMEREDNENREKAERQPEVKEIDRQLENLRKATKKLEERKAKLCKVREWRARNEITLWFEKSWDEVSMILDSKKRQEAKIDLLKRYNLAR